ncbi:MAG: PLP-dependent aminotransferase family protein [Hydrogenophaga sp.]|nr:PLP-dependent aminotransferase family protein [Hydrogenophaga sp.]
MIYLELDGQGDTGRQLVRALRNAIRTGRLATGARLPSTRELAAQLGMARNTVLYAYEVLCAERLVAGRVGAGTFVTGTVAARPVAAPRADLPPQTPYAQRLRALMPEPAGRVGSAWRHDFQFSAPLLDLGLFPAWAKALAHAAERTEASYPPSTGHPALREEIALHLARHRGIACEPGDVLVVNGALQGLALIARVLLAEGERVAVEDPTLPAMRALLRAHGAEVVPVGVDTDGMDTTALAAIAPKLVVVHPSGQFPLGVRLSPPRQQALLDFARDRGGWVVEFDQDSELLDAADAGAALHGADRHGRVVYVGSFSRLLTPSLRLGYIVAPAGLRGDLVRAKALLDVASPAIDQMALAHFMKTGRLERHLHRARAELRRRRAALRESVAVHCGRHLWLAPTSPALHGVGWLPGWSSDAMTLLKEEAARRDVRLYPIGPCHEQAAPHGGLLLGFAGLSVAQIQLATRTLGDALDAAARRGAPTLKRA